MIIGRGLGTLWVTDSSGNTIDCDQWSNIFNTACWGFGTPVVPVPPGSTAPTAAGSPNWPANVPAPATVDCTQFWNALTNSQCSFSTYTSSTLFLPVLAIAVGALFLLKR